MAPRSRRFFAAAVLAPVVTFWVWIGPGAVRYLVDPPEPPYDQPSMLPGLLSLGGACTGATVLGLAVLLYALRRGERRTDGDGPTDVDR